MIHKRNWAGFSIVEMLTVVIVISILASVVVVAYNGVQQRAQTAKRDADLANLAKAIRIARTSASKTLLQITSNDGWIIGHCISPAENPAGVEPRLLAKSHICWTMYYFAIDAISLAAGVNLNGLKSGDARGNPYGIDENQGEGGNCSLQDTLLYFTGNGITATIHTALPLYETCP
jgi:prepilin-type N-terminal cleavage/methylation domain-containing protein